MTDPEAFCPHCGKWVLLDDVVELTDIVEFTGRRGSPRGVIEVADG